nr:MAG TPA: hypothetical protein [Caudoviricetes sp.]
MTQTRPTLDTFTPAGLALVGAFLRSVGLSLLSWCVTCATLDSMILYNRPRTRGEVADFSAAAYGRLYVIVIFSAAVRVARAAVLPYKRLFAATC